RRVAALRRRVYGVRVAPATLRRARVSARDAQLGSARGATSVDHCFVQLDDGAASGATEEKGQQSMNQASAPAGDHARSESAGHQQMLRVRLAHGVRMRGEWIGHPHGTELSAGTPLPGCDRLEKAGDLRNTVAQIRRFGRLGYRG